jgi:hypothetical protein
LWHYLGKVPDRRKRQGRRFELVSILGVVVAAVLCGRRDLAGITRWALELKGKPDLLRLFGIARDDTPCHATFHNVLSSLNIKALERMLWSWMKRLLAENVLAHTALDGKTLRGSRAGEYPGVQLIAAYAVEVKSVLRQMKVEPGMNELSAALRLVKGVPLEGAIMSGDAIYANKRLSREIVEGGGDYVFTVKDNQPDLLADVKAAFERPSSPLRGAHPAA